MQPQEIVATLREQFRERPYWTTAALVGVGWVLGRSLPLRAVIAVAGIGARALAASAIEDAVRGRVTRTDAREETT